MPDTLRKYDTGFTQVSNQILTEPTLSLKAKGIYAYLFSKPDGWTFYLNTIKREVKEGYKAFHSGIKELIDAGYIKKTQKNDNGKFGGNIYTFATPEEINRLAKTANRQNGKTNNTNIKNNTKEKIKNKKETSLRDNSNYPFGVVSQEDTMKLEDVMKKAKDKTQEAKDRKEKKQEQRASAFEKRKSNAVLLEEYFYSLLPDKVVPYARNTQEPDSIYKFASDCKNVGLVDLRDQKAVLKYFVDNWDFFCKMFTETRYCGMEPYPNLYNIVFCFYRAGLITNGFGTHVSRNAFKKGDK